MILETSVIFSWFSRPKDKITLKQNNILRITLTKKNLIKKDSKFGINPKLAVKKSQFVTYTICKVSYFYTELISAIEK